jgi:mono/diheme cytochrome c family protein
MVRLAIQLMSGARLLMLLFLTTLAASSFAGETNLVGAASIKVGRSLFLKNCAHCHGDDASGDEGPDLHGLKRSDEWIARRIRNGVKGEMTAFGEKFSQSDVDAVIAYLRSLAPPDHSAKRDGVALGIVINRVCRANGVFEFGFTAHPARVFTAAAVTNLSSRID